MRACFQGVNNFANGTATIVFTEWKISENSYRFFAKIVWNQFNFAVWIYLISRNSYRNKENLLSCCTYFWQKSRESNGFHQIIDQTKFFSGRVNSFFHTVWKNEKFPPTQIVFRHVVVEFFHICTRSYLTEFFLRKNCGSNIWVLEYYVRRARRSAEIRRAWIFT